MTDQYTQQDPTTQYPQPNFGEQKLEHPGLESEMDPKPDYGYATYRGSWRLEGKKAIITGGDSGIGRAVALAFAREGADVAIAYLSEHEDAQETKRVVEAAGRGALTLPGDISDEAVCRSLVEQTVQRFGRIDILVNNAAFQGKAVEKFEELDAQRVEHTFKTNIIAMFHLVRHALPHMQPGGAIINVASIQAYQPSPQLLPYSTTKGAIVTFTKGLAQELTPKGIRVNAVAPGPVWTPLIPMSMPPEAAVEFGADGPIGRTAQPAELAPPYVFLASEESRYVSGEILAVTGGQVTA